MRRLAFPLAGLCGLALAVVPALAADKTVTTTSSSSFSPADVTVRPGEKVTIHNGSNGNHNLYWQDGATGHPGTPTEFTGDTMDWSVERTFDATGDFVYFCRVHGSASGGMRGVVHVKAEDGTTSGTTTTEQPPPPPPGGTTTTPPPGGTTTTPPPAEDTAAPRVLSARATATRRGVRVRLTLDEPATVTARLVRGRRTLARRTVEVQDELTFRITRRLRKGKYSVKLTLEDAAGNVARRSLSARRR